MSARIAFIGLAAAAALTLTGCNTTEDAASLNRYADVQLAVTSTSTSAAWICDTLDGQPNESGVWQIVIKSFEKNLTADQAGKLIVSTVSSECPKYIPLLKQWAEHNG